MTDKLPDFVLISFLSAVYLVVSGKITFKGSISKEDRLSKLKNRSSETFSILSAKSAKFAPLVYCRLNKIIQLSEASEKYRSVLQILVRRATELIFPWEIYLNDYSESFAFHPSSNRLFADEIK